MASPRDRDMELARLRIAARCPAVRVGDVWRWPHARNTTVTVLGFVPIDDDTPWPRLKLLFPSGDVDASWGLPVLLASEIVKRGGGEEWTPPVAPPPVDELQTEAA